MIQLSFAIIGVQKASTTALAQYLGQHPSLYIPAEKETHFFKRDLAARGPLDKDLTTFTDRFVSAPPDALLGDATPIYFYWPYSLELLKAHNPEIRLILSLRHPVMRAYSAWSMEKRRDREPLDFSSAIRDGRRRVTDAPFGVHHIYSYVERGFYAAQLERLFAQFDRRQIFVLRADQVTPSHPQMTDIQKFLGLEPVSLDPISGNIHPSSLPPQDTLEADFAYLQDVFQHDLDRLSTMIEIDISDWIQGPPPIDF